MRDMQERGPASTPDPASHATPDSVTAAPDRQPGEWPTSAAALRERWRREHNRRTWAFNVIREHIAAQPTPGAMRAVCRLWCRDLTLTADALATALQNQEPTE